MKRIGERIRKKRELLDLHMNELAEKVGISPSALSQIEKGKSFPSVLTLKAIAENLFTTVGELIGENESLANHPVLYRKDIVLLDQSKSGTRIYLLSPRDANKYMDSYLLRYSKASGVDGYFGNITGQVFCYLLSGEVRFELEGKNFILKPGDTIYFNARSSFDAINIFDGISEMLWIQSPPKF